MAHFFSRRKLILATTILVAAIVVAALLPLIASTQIVRDRIATELSSWSGYAVDVGEGPEIDVWPRFRATLRDVHFRDEAGETVVWSDRIEVTISALSVLRGQLFYSRARFIRPILTVKASERFGFLPSLPLRGKIRNAVETTAAALASDQEQITLPDDQLGVIEVSEGGITSAETVVATDLEASLEWPALDRPASLTAQLTWRGQPVSVALTSAQPLIHLAGGTGELDLGVTSPPLNLAYVGEIGQRSDANLVGTLQMTGPSLRQAVAWLRPEASVGLADSAFELASRVSGTVWDLRFENALMRFGQSAGLGGFELSHDGGAAKLSGSMAFDQLHLPEARSLTGLIASSTATSALPAGLRDLNLDLRISATAATVGDIALSELAATAQVTDTQTLLDISDARLFDGVLQASFRREGDRGPVDLRAELRAFNGATAATALGYSALSITGTGNASLALSGNNAETVSLSGTAKLAFGAGTLTAPSVEDFGSRLQADGFFALHDLPTGTQSLQSASADLSIERGRSELRVNLITATEQIDLSGLVAPSGGLALFGSLKPMTGANPAQPFFVGGSPSAPLISRAIPPAVEP